VGYDLIQGPKLEWNVLTGPGYQRTWFESTTEGEPDSHGSAVLVFGTTLDWELTRRVDLLVHYQGQYTRREVGETTHHGVVTLKTDITKGLDFDVSFIWDRVSQPMVEADGETPTPDDFRLVVSLGLDF